jgi:hypothetical protein
MDFLSISARHPVDCDMPVRAFRLRRLKAVIDGTLYDCFAYSFTDEQNGAGEYIKVHDRWPNVTYRFLRSIVDDSGSFLFGELRFPSIDCNDEDLRGTYRDIVAESKMCNVIREAAIFHVAAEKGVLPGKASGVIRPDFRRLFQETRSQACLSPRNQ